MDEVRLNEFDADEWFDVCRSIQPGLSREEFDPMWDEFQEMKAERQRQQELH